MTANTTNKRGRDSLLTEILDTVESIDKNVGAILDRLDDHLEEHRYRSEWRGYDPTDEYALG